MPGRSRALVMDGSVRILEVVLDRYGRLFPIERGGRLYEALGVRGLYQVVSRLFGETMLPTSRDLRQGQVTPQLDLTPEAAWELRERTRYFEVSNLVICLTYVPLIALCALLKSSVAYYAGLLFCLHGALVLIERYKRALYGLYLTWLETAAPAVPPVAASPAASAAQERPDGLRAAPVAGRSWYFTPRRFETERLYRALGIERVRQMVITFTRLTALPPEQRERKPRSISGTSASSLADFDAETRTSEAAHLIGVLLQTPFLVLFLTRRTPLGISYSLFLLCLNVSFVLLQRATRVRLWRVMERRRASRQ